MVYRSLNPTDCGFIRQNYERVIGHVSIEETAISFILRSSWLRSRQRNKYTAYISSTEAGRSMFLHNSVNYLPEYMVSQPTARRKAATYTENNTDTE
jgi:hypothetical protein